MMRRPLYESPEFCGACHQQFLPESMGGAGPAAAHTQLPEWRASPYAVEGSPDFKTCNDCHMPWVEADDPAATDGKVRSHRFPGANVAHAVKAGLPDQAAASLALLRDGVTLAVAPAAGAAKPGHVAVDVRVTNAGAGHRFPSGTTDISEAWLEVTAEAGGARIFASGLLDERHYLDPDAHVWRTLYVDENNLPVDLHNLTAIHETKLDTYIAPKQTETVRYDVPIPEGVGGDVSVRVRLRLRKANQRWNDWLFNFDGRTTPVTDVHERRLALPAPTPAAVAAAPTPGEDSGVRRVAPPAAAAMIDIPAGPAIMGVADGDADERPVRRIAVAAFSIDRLPVTNAEYREYLVARGREGPRLQLPWAERYSWRGDRFPEGTDAQPVILVTAEEARDYCRWRGKRLPTEAEWEKAARGPHGARYPWGDRWDDGACAAAEGQDIPARVGLCPNRASAYGVEDMVGGVLEWTADPYLAYDRTHLHPNADEWIVTFGAPSLAVRGVPNGQVGPSTTAAARVGQADGTRARIGFRCAAGGQS